MVTRPQKTQVSPAQTEDLADLAPRERILNTARELFYQYGLNAVGVEGIAAAALTNKMTLYRHFKSKDDLIVAYVTEIAAEGDAVWKELEARFPKAPEKLVDAWVKYVDDVLTHTYARGCALANAAVELPADHPARAVIETYKERKRKRLVDIFAAAHYREPQQLAEEVFLLFEGARVNLQCGSKIPVARVIKMLRELLARAPRRKKPS